MIFLQKLINDDENNLFILDYYFADFFLRLFSIGWVFFIGYSYNENTHRPESLYEPTIWFQEWFLPQLPTPKLFYCVLISTILLCIYTIINNKIIYRGVLFLFLLWLNAVKWNYNFFSHVGHLFLLAHLFTIFIPPNFNIKNIAKKDIVSFSLSIRWALSGVLVTYTMAGFWKFTSLFYRLLLKPNSINWISEDAVKLNAIVSARIWDEAISKTLLSVYEIPFVWQIGTLFIFIFQLLAVFGAFNKKFSYLVLTTLLIFHIYNMLFINTHFYASSAVLIIFFFPYHKLKIHKQFLRF